MRYLSPIKLALAPCMDLDALVFEPGERGPRSELKLKSEAIEAMHEEDQRVILSFIDACIKKRRPIGLAAS